MAHFVKVTNHRLGNIAVPSAGLDLPPGTSFHKLEVFQDLAANHKNVVASLQMHERAGELSIETIEVEGDALPEAPKKTSGLLSFLENTQDKPAVELPIGGAPPLSSALHEALEQINRETSTAVLEAWFHAEPTPIVEITEAISARHAALS